MKKFFAITVLVLYSLTGSAQYDESVEDVFDILTEQWLDKSSSLKEYSGITSYCSNVKFRQGVNEIINAVHHYDSLILDKINDPVASLSMDLKEQGRIYKDILKMESEYSTRSFIEHMKESCAFRKEIVKNKDMLKASRGSESYDAQIVLLETVTQRYLKHIDKLVSKVDDHLHLLYISQ